LDTLAANMQAHFAGWPAESSEQQAAKEEEQQEVSVCVCVSGGRKLFARKQHF